VAAIAGAPLQQLPKKRDGGNSKYFNHSRYSRYVNSSKNNSNSSVASQKANYDASYCLYPLFD
jgi:hypothetical protein